jgi:hypothetical protein
VLEVESNIVTKVLNEGECPVRVLGLLDFRCTFGFGHGHTIIISLCFSAAFLGGIVGNSEILICSHTLDLAGRK